MTRRYAHLIAVAILGTAFSAPIYGQRSSACGSVEGAELGDRGGDYCQSVQLRQYLWYNHTA
jgi:hypothetical protein